MSIKIAVVTDIHHGKESTSKKGESALSLMAAFASFVAENKPDLVLDLGDRISDMDPETDLELEREVNAAFVPIRELAPVFHICGNHDRDFLSIAQNEEIFGQTLRNQVHDVGGIRVVLWRADTVISRPLGFNCPDSDIAWLADVIAAADRPLLIASHVPLSGHSQIGNYYFQRNPEYSTYPQGERIREVLRASKVPTVCLAGHVHWNTLTTIDGIPHLSQQSLTESFVMSSESGAGKPCGSFGLLHITTDTIDYQVVGADAFRCILPLAQTERRWYPPMGNFAELADHSERQARIAAFQSQAQAAQ